MTEELKKLLEKAHVSLLLDSYDAIFSDFDPRPYAERALSDDFLVEVKRAVREANTGALEMRFLIPKHLKNTHEEVVIKERLHHYFLKQVHFAEKNGQGIMKKGIGMAVIGFVLLFVSTYLSHQLAPSLFVDFLKVLMEPAGWFTIWYGFDRIFYDAKSLRPELAFYQKMSKAEVHFDVY